MTEIQSSAARKVSPKVVAAAAAAFVVPTLIVLVDYLLGEGRGLFNGWPVLAQVAVLSLLSTAGTALAGYLRRDPLRDAGARVVAE